MKTFNFDTFREEATAMLDEAKDTEGLKVHPSYDGVQVNDAGYVELREEAPGVCLLGLMLLGSKTDAENVWRVTGPFAKYYGINESEARELEMGFGASSYADNFVNPFYVLGRELRQHAIKLNLFKKSVTTNITPIVY